MCGVGFALGVLPTTAHKFMREEREKEEEEREKGGEEREKERESVGKCTCACVSEGGGSGLRTWIHSRSLREACACAFVSWWVCGRFSCIHRLVGT